MKSQRDRVKLVFADDDPALRFALRALLALVEEVEIVGEATDGDQAVELAFRTAADVVLLDVNMPRMDGVTAAEAILRFRPQTAVILHTAEPSDQVARRAAALDVPLLSKMGYEQLIEQIVRQPVQPDAQPTTIEPLVLAALAGKNSLGVIVAGPEGDVRFYNGITAELLSLPLPPVPMTLAEIRRRYTVQDQQGRPVAEEQGAFSQVFAEGETATGTIGVDRDGRIMLIAVEVIPFHGEPGELVGAAAYLRPVGTV